MELISLNIPLNCVPASTFDLLRLALKSPFLNSEIAKKKNDEHFMCDHLYEDINPIPLWFSFIH